MFSVTLSCCQNAILSEALSHHVCYFCEHYILNTWAWLIAKLTKIYKVTFAKAITRLIWQYQGKVRVQHLKGDFSFIFGRFRSRLSLQKIGITRQNNPHVVLQVVSSPVFVFPRKPIIRFKKWSSLHFKLHNQSLKNWLLKNWLSLRMIKRLMIDTVRDCSVKLCYWIVSRRLTGTRSKGGRVSWKSCQLVLETSEQFYASLKILCGFNQNYEEKNWIQLWNSLIACSHLNSFTLFC